MKARRDELPPLLLQFDLDPIGAYGAALSGAHAILSADDLVYVVALPRILDELASRNLKATFFVVGGWLEGTRTHAAIRRAVDEGHELANHSWSHPLGLSNLPSEELEHELDRTHAAVRSIAGVDCRGFRAPGWDVSGALLQLLLKRRYAYDASVLPSWTAPLQAAAFLATTALRGRVGTVGPGAWRAACAPAAPYVPDLERPWRHAARDRATHSLLEIPAGVSPWRIPYCGTIQLAFGTSGLRGSVRRCARPLAYVFHGVDFLTRSELGAELRGHPASRRDQRRTDARRRTILDTLTRDRIASRTDTFAASFSRAH